MTQRTDRIDELLRQEIGAILSREVADPRIGFATVTKVETAPDLGHARVWVSVIGQRGERTETIAALEHAMPFVRHELGGRLRLRRIPVLHVRLDDTIERGTRVLQLLERARGRRRLDRRRRPTGETLPTPVVRLRHEGDLPDEPPPAAEPPPPARRRRRRPSGPATPASQSRGKHPHDRRGGTRKPKR